MNINDLLGAPQFDHYRREYVYPSGFQISEFEYARRYWEMQRKLEERHRKIECEDRLSAIQATAVIEELIGGTAPSVVYRRLKARNIV